MSSTGNRIRAVESVRNWNEAFPIGTVVIFEGTERRTWSHAGLGFRDVPVVWLDGVEEAVALDRLQVPGWERVSGRKR
jgi:hypothetical protein